VGRRRPRKGSEKYEAVMKELLALDFTLDPTFTIYQATRDVMRARNADWQAEYAMPSLTEFFTPSRINHGSFFFDWGTERRRSRGRTTTGAGWPS
jgi:hypothetical protein